MQKPTIPKGTRDFSPEEMARRNYIFDTIKEVYKLYGFQQIETPAMENLSTLMGKYGEEGDKLLFKILNSGDFMDNVISNDLDVFVADTNRLEDDNWSEIYDELDENDDIITANEKKRNKKLISLTNKICEKGLRYDLTVPFARFVVMNRDKISFPFKRYQIQPVWRADRPQKGRYREFYQCDADIVGSDSLLNEVELVQIIDEVFRRLKINICIKINNRKILSGIAEVLGETDKITDITVAIDKFEKIGLERVNEELSAKGISAEAIQKLQPIILLQGTNEEKLSSLKNILAASEIGLKGVEELGYIFNYIEKLKIYSKVELDLTLARGLNYYTGAIFEVKALDVEIGSITGGGRYDNLTGVFGLPNVSGVGISFGADRIYDVLNQLNLYPENATSATKILFVNFGEKEMEYCLPLLQELRSNGISAEIFPDAAKLKKQMAYADGKGIPFVAIAGENEMASGKITLKNMTTGEQTLIDKGNISQNITLK